jgi:AraC family transcriptional regulator, regulatory protein of adaptative response / DNA-3-methyladenine glycosylase II
MVEQFGPRVPGLTHGLTHLFSSAELLAAGDLADLDLPPAAIKGAAALAAALPPVRSCSIMASGG